MKRLSILIPHYKSWKLLAICVHAFKRYEFPLPYEIIVCDNSPGHPSIKALTNTELGDGVKVVQGNPDLPSHAHGLELAYAASTGDAIFTTETDCFPTQDSWGNAFIKASSEYDYIAPYMELAGGIFGHPAGALVKRHVVESAQKWIDDHKDWVFVPSSATRLGTSDKGYHVVCLESWLNGQYGSEEILKQVSIWKKSGPWQNMLSFDDDSFDSYWRRDGIKSWEPAEDRVWYNRIGYEPGQWLWYYVQHHNIPRLKAPFEITWMPGRENRQAASSVILGGMTHLWAGTSATVVDGLEDEVKRFKREQVEHYFSQLPEKLRHDIELLEKEDA
jgi:hypothetical protein